MENISLSRDILDLEWNDTTFKVFIWLLFNADEEGQIETSIRELSRKTNHSEREIRTALKRMGATHKTTQQTTHQKSVITILDYDSYLQNSNTKGHTKRHTKRHTENEEKETIEERKNKFMWNVAEVGKGVYPNEMLRAFFDYWTECNPNGQRMRFEMQKVFDIKKRLVTWNNNNNQKTYGSKRTNARVPIERIVEAGRAWAEVIK